MLNQCEVCSAIFPNHWALPIHCDHSTPGKDYRVQDEPERVSMAVSKPNPWQLIHSRIAEFLKDRSKQWIAEDQKRWHDTQFIPLIPRNCGCENHWDPLAKKIDWSTSDSAFRSLWELHNEVSSKHAGNPTVSYEQALELWTGPRVSFIVSSYRAAGGTETFHQTLLPRLRHRRNLIGFASAAFHGGDGSRLKVPYAMGVEAGRKMAAESDIVVTWGIDDLRSVLPESRPHVISVHHADETSDWSNSLQLRQLDLIDQIVCVHPGAARYLRERTNTPVEWIANCVDPTRLRVGSQAASLRELHGIPDSSKVLLFGHRLSGEKQPLKAIEIANELPEEWVLVVAGDGPLLNDCRRMATSRVRVVGRTDSLADWLSISDRFLSLAEFEGYGLSVAESLAFGVPVVSAGRHSIWSSQNRQSGSLPDCLGGRYPGTSESQATS